jgi:hypothetical protein
MISRIVCLFFLSVSSLTILAQDRIKLLGIETGINFLEAQMTDNQRIRASSSQYYDDGYAPDNTEAHIQRTYGGVKAEMHSLSGVFAFCSGVRYSRISNSISKQYSPDYFYYLFRQSETTTEYLRIKEIDQVTSYISVPVEMRIFFYRQRKFRLYCLVGTEFGYSVASKNKVEFDDPSMEQHESELSATIEKPASFYYAVNGRGGLVIGGDKPFLDIGITLPMLISRSASTLSEPGVGGGFHLQVLKKF